MILINLSDLDDVSEVGAIDEVVGLQEDLPQSTLTDWVVFSVELVKTMERIPVLTDRKQILQLRHHYRVAERDTILV